jgi:hypothetical protein
LKKVSDAAEVISSKKAGDYDEENEENDDYSEGDEVPIAQTMKAKKASKEKAKEKGKAKAGSQAVPKKTLLTVAKKK